METKFIKTLITLGIPGVALGIFYLLLRQFGFRFGEIGSIASATIAILFLLIVGGITFYALREWSPRKEVYESSAKRVLSTPSRDMIELWIHNYPPSPKSKDGEEYHKYKDAAEQLKEQLIDKGFHNAGICSTTVKSHKIMIKHVNSVPESMLSEIVNIVSQIATQFKIEKGIPLCIRLNEGSVLHQRPSVSIYL
jgi:hypothetical protein